MRHGFLLGLATFIMLFAHCARAEEPQAIEPLVSHDTRLMIFSPHPDDESIGAGGLIQRVLGAGGKVRVVFMTSGDGYPEGVAKKDHIAHPTAIEYRAYGRNREREALKALMALGMRRRDVTFLGFPDGGLCQLLSKYRHDPQAYTSPFTRESRPIPADMVIPHTDYNDQDLRKELVRLLTGFRPTILALTPPEDQHPDHCATYHLVSEALQDLRKKDPAIDPKVLTFLVHFGGWPEEQAPGAGPGLNPPPDFPDKERKWISFSLSPREVERKRRAILQYRTQMLVIGRFLTSFARTNELFVPVGQGLAGAMEKTPCSCK